MHIPDGFLSTLVAVIFWGFSAIAVAYALRRVGKDLGERQVPLMGVLAAAIFAGQLLNFSVTGGTSGHLLGAALATILLGPWAAVIVLTSVVSIQALIFQDGGLLALGANLFNMAVIGVTVSYFVYTSVKKLARGRSWGLFVGGFLAAWLSIVVASLSAALQLALSGTSPANISVPAMSGIHMLIGIGEGLITVGALAFLYSARRDLFTPVGSSPKGGALVWVFGLAIALACKCPAAEVYALDISSEALALARQNAARHGVATGSSTTKRAPDSPSGRSSTHARPPWSATCSATRASPRPTPSLPALRRPAPEPRENRSKTRSRSSAGTPGPLSSICNSSARR